MQKQKNKQTGITLIALVVTIIILIILAGISINMIVGENGIINMAQRAKNETEQAAKDEQQALAGIMGKRYADYNGQLKVSNNKLVNQYDEEIQLRGVSSMDGTSSPYYKYLNEESIRNLKNWGANVVRIVVKDRTYTSEEAIEGLYEAIDICIKYNMYVIIDWHESDIINQDIISNGKLFLTEIATKYKDRFNIIYEICNEPLRDIGWEQIKEYSEEIIPGIRNIDNDAIILTALQIVTPEDVIGNMIHTENIMYTYHMHTGSNTTYSDYSKIQSLIDNNIPLFISEWGTTNNDGVTGFYEDFSDLWVKYMETNNLSWCNFNFSDYTVGGNTANSSIVQGGLWNNALSDEILTNSGKYIKNILNGRNQKYKNNINMAINYEQTHDFWNNEYRDKISSIITQNTISIPDNIIQKWDISMIPNSQSVIAYIVPDDTNSSLYKLTICADGEILVPKEIREYFSAMSSVQNIDLSNFNTKNVESMSNMFRQCQNLTNINIENLNTSNVTNMQGIFRECTNLKSINLEKFDLSKVQTVQDMFYNDYNLETVVFNSNTKTGNMENISEMFWNCNSLSNINIENWDTSKVTDMSSLFRNCYELSNINIGNWDVSKVEDMSYMFENTKKIGNIDLSNWNTSNVADMRYMFYNDTSNIETIKLTNWVTEKVTNMSYMFYGNNNLKELYLNNMVFSQVSSYENMFLNAKSGITVKVKDDNAKSFIESRMEEAGINGVIN